MSARRISRANVTRRHARSHSRAWFIGHDVVEAVLFTVAGGFTVVLLLAVAGAVAHGLRLA